MNGSALCVAICSVLSVGEKDTACLRQREKPRSLAVAPQPGPSSRFSSVYICELVQTADVASGELFESQELHWMCIKRGREQMEVLAILQKKR